MRYKYLKLKRPDRHFLRQFRAKGWHHARELTRAHVLLALDQRVPIRLLTELLGINRASVWRTGQAYRKGGLAQALYDDPRPGQPRKYRTSQEAEVVSLACSAPPQGRKRWTLVLLTQAARQRPALGQINRESIRMMLKKTNVSLGSSRCGASGK